VTVHPELLDRKLAEFVFVPISHVLRSSGNVPVQALELSLECISLLLKTGWKDHLAPELFGQLLILFTFLASPSSVENGIPATSEELQATAFKNIAQLVTGMTQDPEGRRCLTDIANVPSLGKAVLVMVDSIAEVPSNDVKIHALDAVQAVTSGLDDLDALASFLPRMVSSLTRTLTPSSSGKVTYRVYEKGLQTLSLLLLRVFSDDETSNLPSDTEAGKLGTKEKVLRSSSWLQATAGQIKVALSNVLKLRYHDRKEVQDALLKLCLNVVQHCRGSLSECTSMMIETLVNLAGRGGGLSSVETDFKSLLSSDEKLADLLRESLHGWVMVLPRLTQSKDDNNRRRLIQGISTTVRLLNDERIDLTAVDVLFAENLRNSVSNIITDPKGIGHIIEPTMGASVDTGIIASTTRATSFRPLTLPSKGQDDMLSEIRSLVYEIAKADSATTIAQDLVGSIGVGGSEMQLATFWLSVNLLQDMTQHHALIDDFLDMGSSNIQSELLDELYSLSLSQLSQPLEETETHWQSQALSLEVVAMQARRYATDFRVELIEALYPVLHLLGSPNAALQNHVITCLNVIAEACEYKSVSDLVVANVDYVVNAVGLKLNYHDISPQAPQVLLMMMRLCGPSLLPYLDDLVGSIFSALERYHGYPKLVKILFSVLRGMAEEGVKVPQLMITEDQKVLQRTWKKTSTSEVVVEIKDATRKASSQDEEDLKFTDSTPLGPWKDETEQVGNDQPVSGEGTEHEIAERLADSSPPAPRTFDILLKISELTQHYLTASSPSLRTSLLSLLHTTVPALARHENSFLPLINTLWPVLVPRLEDPEAYVVSNALDIISLMCTHARDFMKSRIEGTWEGLRTLHHQAFTRTNSRNGRTKLISVDLQMSQTSDTMIRSSTGADIDHIQSERYLDAPTRMKRESLTGLLAAIAQYVAIRGELLDDLIDMLDPVLGRDDVRRAIEYRNPDAVWLRLFKKNQSQATETGDTVAGSAEAHLSFAKALSGNPLWNFVQL
jgi:hypothetical protein